MKYKQSRTILSAQSAEERKRGKERRWKELNNLLQDQQLLSRSMCEIREGNKRLFKEELRERKT